MALATALSSVPEFLSPPAMPVPASRKPSRPCVRPGSLAAEVCKSSAGPWSVRLAAPSRLQFHRLFSFAVPPWHGGIVLELAFPGKSKSCRRSSANSSASCWLSAVCTASNLPSKRMSVVKSACILNQASRMAASRRLGIATQISRERRPPRSLERPLFSWLPYCATSRWPESNAISA